jgi:hypothetical protein
MYCGVFPTIQERDYNEWRQNFPENRFGMCRNSSCVRKTAAIFGLMEIRGYFISIAPYKVE